MIQKGMIIAICDDCKKIRTFYSINHMRSEGWVVARNRDNCYCIRCGKFRKNVGRKGGRRLQPLNNDHIRN